MNLIKKWDLWFWVLGLIYVISRLARISSFVEEISTNGFILLGTTLIGQLFIIWAIIKIFQVCFVKIKNNQNRGIFIFLLFLVIMVIASYVGFAIYRLYQGL